VEERLQEKRRADQGLEQPGHCVHRLRGESELLLVSVKGLDKRPWSQMVTNWLTVARLQAAVIQVLAHGSIVP
jgi:hypothetical protein